MNRVNKKVRPRSNADKEKQIYTCEILNALYEGRQLILNAFKSRIFPLNEMKFVKLHILCIKQNKLLRKYITI